MLRDTSLAEASKAQTGEVGVMLTGRTSFPIPSAGIIPNFKVLLLSTDAMLLSCLSLYLAQRTETKQESILDHLQNQSHFDRNFPCLVLSAGPENTIPIPHVTTDPMAKTIQYSC